MCSLLTLNAQSICDKPNQLQYWNKKKNRQWQAAERASQPRFAVLQEDSSFYLSTSDGSLKPTDE